eukprot:351209-Chlamydomonas_euryale.AAC.1
MGILRLSLPSPPPFAHMCVHVQAVQEARLCEDDTAWSARDTPDAAGAPASTGGGANGAGVANGHGVPAFKDACKRAVLEYFDSGDAAEVGRRLVELDDPGLLPVFVKLAVVQSLDRKDKERELVSLLLVHLCPKVCARKCGVLCAGLKGGRAGAIS